MKLTFWKVSALAAMAVGLPLLVGCGLIMPSLVTGVPTAQETASMTGHPFVLESVKFAPNVTPGKATE